MTIIFLDILSYQQATEYFSNFFPQSPYFLQIFSPTNKLQIVSVISTNFQSKVTLVKTCLICIFNSERMGHSSLGLMGCVETTEDLLLNSHEGFWKKSTFLIFYILKVYFQQFFFEFRPISAAFHRSPPSWGWSEVP